MHFSTAAILSAFTAIPLASGLGINCRGSSGCTGSSNTMKSLQSFMNTNVPDNFYFYPGEQIICNKIGVSVAFLEITRAFCLDDVEYRFTILGCLCPFIDLRILPIHVGFQVVTTS